MAALISRIVTNQPTEGLRRGRKDAQEVGEQKRGYELLRQPYERDGHISVVRGIYPPESLSDLLAIVEW